MKKIKISPLYIITGTINNKTYYCAIENGFTYYLASYFIGNENVIAYCSEELAKQNLNIFKQQILRKDIVYNIVKLDFTQIS